MLWRTISAVLMLTGFLTVTLSAARAQTPAKLKSEEEQMREVMVVISRQLGVTCTACHNTDNFKSSEKQSFKTAREHMKLTQLLIDSGMNGKSGPKADCYMCHRGELKPDYKEKVPPMLKK